MKIQTQANQLVVSNSGLSTIVAGVIATLVGLGIVGVALATKPGEGILGLIFLLVGAFFLFLARSTRVTLQSGGESEIRVKRVFFGAPKVESFATSDIAAVELLSGMDISQQNGSQRTSTIYLVMKNGTKFELGEKGQSGGFAVNGINLAGFGKAPLTDQANQIASFLQVPMQGSDFSNMPEVIGKFMSGMANGDFKGKTPRQAQEEMIQLQQTTTPPSVPPQQPGTPTVDKTQPPQ
jgi:hypothetical protein